MPEAATDERRHDQLREEVRRWIADHWDPERTVREWWQLTCDAGWQFPAWPEGCGGRGLSPAEARAVHEVFASDRVLGPPFGVAQTHGAPLVIAHGTTEQRQRLVPPVALGIESWCQLFSEPDAGSDLAGLRTSATRDEDRWIVNGQKIWTSGAQNATRGILLARTDFDAPKHRGLTMFIIDLQQPGVEIQPIRQMNLVTGYFNEVFLSDAVVLDADRIGEPGDGWRAALTTLAFERGDMNARVPGLITAPPAAAYGALDRAAGDVLDDDNTVPYVKSRAWIDARALARLAVDRGSDDLVVREALADMYALERAVDWLDDRAKHQARAGRALGVESNLIKLAKSDLGRRAERIATRILGVDAGVVGPGAPVAGALADLILTVPSFSIAGGTDEIQRNVIAERGLGLPREIDPARNRPFNELRSATSVAE